VLLCVLYDPGVQGNEYSTSEATEESVMLTNNNGNTTQVIQIAQTRPYLFPYCHICFKLRLQDKGREPSSAGQPHLMLFGIPAKQKIFRSNSKPLVA
jgi:hypothetical protein